MSPLRAWQTGGMWGVWDGGEGDEEERWGRRERQTAAPAVGQFEAGLGTVKTRAEEKPEEEKKQTKMRQIMNRSVVTARRCEQHRLTAP